MKFLTHHTDRQHAALDRSGYISCLKAAGRSWKETAAVVKQHLSGFCSLGNLLSLRLKPVPRGLRRPLK